MIAFANGVFVLKKINCVIMVSNSMGKRSLDINIAEER
ncbi:hypothetical protein ASZ90_006401 [hydrocarbon metagenome]|uniref:Uncharacterized protein n=1 Tax=hydrocarbon metagenome TaxID=938273 RepID=A0A0W8FSF4_9ZZZZ